MSSALVKAWVPASVLEVGAGESELAVGLMLVTGLELTGALLLLASVLVEALV